jgi:hypothetical protein
VILSDEQIADAVHRARRFSGAYTGTAGTLALYTLHLVDMVRQLQEGPMTFRDDNREPGTSPAERLLEVAQATVRQRRATYGPPGEHFARTVAMVNGLLGDRLRSPLTATSWLAIRANRRPPTLPSTWPATRRAWRSASRSRSGRAGRRSPDSTIRHVRGLDFQPRPFTPTVLVVPALDGTPAASPARPSDASGRPRAGRGRSAS